MSIPGENLGNSGEKAPNQAKAVPEFKTGQDIEVHTKLNEQKADNTEFLTATEKMTPAEKQELLDKAKQWQSAGDLDLLRAAGLSLDQIKSAPLDRHTRLAAMYLTRSPSAGRLEFTADFKQNEQALWDLDLADLLPPNILKIDIVDEQGKIIFADASRSFRDNQPGYLTAKGERATVQTGWKIQVKETQSSLAIKDQRQGKQTYENAAKEELYLVDNSRKTALKQEVRTQAAAKGMEVVTDKNFFDKILSDLMKSISPAFGDNFQKDGKVDFSKFLNQILATVFGVGIAKTASPSPTDNQSAQKPNPDSAAKSPDQKITYDQSKVEQISKSPEKYSSTIDRNWLLEHVGRNNEEVQKNLVTINFMGANMRVCKLIAPYLEEASQRIKAAGINFHCHQGDCGCQNWRNIRDGKSLSMHSWGTAVDLNVSKNPWQPHLKGTQSYDKMISNMPPEVVTIMKSVGFRWLAPFDPMHFEMAANPYQNQQVLQSASARDAASRYLG